MSFAAILGLVRGGASYWREILIAALALGLLLYRGNYYDCKAGRAAAIIEAQQRADALSAKLEEKQREADAKTEKVKVEYVEKIKTVQVAQECPADERDRLGSRGVRDILGNPKAK